jgi:hypothetical protein
MQLSKIQNIRYSARILGGLASVFYIFIAYKGGLADALKGMEVETVKFFPFMAIAVAGYMIAYVHEKKGGYIMLAGGLALFVFFMVRYWAFDWVRGLVYGLPFIAPGVAFLYCFEKE